MAELKSKQAAREAVESFVEVYVSLFFWYTYCLANDKSQDIMN